MAGSISAAVCASGFQGDVTFTVNFSYFPFLEPTQLLIFKEEQQKLKKNTTLSLSYCLLRSSQESDMNT